MTKKQGTTVIMGKRKYAPPMIKKVAKRTMVNIFRYALLLCLSYLILAPILQNIVQAITHPKDLGMASSVWIPNRVSIQNLHVAYLIMDIPHTLLPTLLYTFVVMALQLFCTLLAGYAFARLKFRGQNLIFFCVILTIIVPSQVIMLPQYLYFKEFTFFGLIPLFNNGKSLNLLDQPVVIYVLSALGMGLKSGLYIYIFRQTFRGLPKELEQAAYVDGAGFMRTFISIVLPSAGAGMITVGVLSFVWNWNDTTFIRIFNPRNTTNLMYAYTRRTASINETINSVSKYIPGDYTFFMNDPLYQNVLTKTSALYVLIPLLVLYLIIQRKFVQGVERSGLVG